MSAVEVVDGESLPPVASPVIVSRDEVETRRSIALSADEYLPNPFDYLSDEQLTRAVAAAHTVVNRRTTQERVDDEARRASEALVASAEARAASIVLVANAQAETVAAEAAAKRADAVSLIERSTQGVEELLEVAAAKAESIRQQAEHVRRESVRAAAARRAEADRLLAEAARRSAERRALADAEPEVAAVARTGDSESNRSSPQAQPPPGSERATPRRVPRGLQLAFERAINDTFKG